MRVVAGAVVITRGGRARGRGPGDRREPGRGRSARSAWRDVNRPVGAESTRRDEESRIARIEADPIAAMHVARLRVADRQGCRARSAGYFPSCGVRPSTCIS